MCKEVQVITKSENIDAAAVFPENNTFTKAKQSSSTV